MLVKHMQLPVYDAAKPSMRSEPGAVVVAVQH